MCKFIGKSDELIFCKLSKSEILRLYSIAHVAMETTKMSNFTCQSKSFISIFFTCQVSACELQPFSYHDLANNIYSQTAKTVFSHLKCYAQYPGVMQGSQEEKRAYKLWVPRVHFGANISMKIVLHIYG